MKAFNKKLIAGAMATSLVLAASGAIAGNYGQQRAPAERLNYIFTQLSLTEAQQAEVLDIMQTLGDQQREAMKATIEAMRNAEERPTIEVRQAMREAHQAAQFQALTDQLNTVLSPEVTEDLVEYLEAHSMGKAFDRGDDARRGQGQRGDGQRGDGQRGDGQRGGNSGKMGGA